MGIKINLSAEDAAQADRSLMPEGKYLVEITKCELTSPKSGPNTHEKMYRVSAKIADGEHKGRYAPMVNVALWYAARFSLINLMQGLGYPITAGDLDVPEPRETVGKKVMMKITHKEYPEGSGEYRMEGNFTGDNPDGTTPGQPAKQKVGLGGRKLGS